MLTIKRKEDGEQQEAFKKSNMIPLISLHGQETVSLVLFMFAAIPLPISPLAWLI